MLRSLFAALALCTMPLVSACATLGNPTVADAVTYATTPICTHTVADDKAYAGILILYNVPAQAYVSADQHMGTNAQWVNLKPTLRADLIKLRGYRDMAKTAYDTCNSTALTSFVGPMTSLRDSLLSRIPQ